MWAMDMDVVFFLIVCVSFVANERAVWRCGVEDYRAYSAVQCSVVQCVLMRCHYLHD